MVCKCLFKDKNPLSGLRFQFCGMLLLLLTFTKYFAVYLEYGHLLVVKTVKNLPAMQETWVRTLGGEDPLEKGIRIHVLPHKEDRYICDKINDMLLGL